MLRIPQREFDHTAVPTSKVGAKYSLVTYPGRRGGQLWATTTNSDPLQQKMWLRQKDMFKHTITQAWLTISPLRIYCSYAGDAEACLATSSLRSRWKIHDVQSQLMKTCHYSLHLKTMLIFILSSCNCRLWLLASMLTHLFKINLFYL